MVTIEGTRTTMTPWKRLEDWERADKTKAQSTLEYINAKMQERFPGNYQVVKNWNPKCRSNLYGVTHIIKFDTPAEETFFKLKYPG